MLRKGSRADEPPWLCDYGLMLWGWLFEVGPIFKGERVNSQELKAWAEGTKKRLTAFEFDTLLFLSRRAASLISDYDGKNVENPLREGERPDQDAITTAFNRIAEKTNEH